VIEKERYHYSSIYGRIEDPYRRTILADADVDMRVPPACRFVPGSMHYFIRFNSFHRNARWSLAWLSRIPWLCSSAEKKCDRIFQSGRSRHAGHRLRTHSAGNKSGAFTAITLKVLA
jgi:hypothetical protein